MLISANITNKEKVFSAVKLLKIIECSLSPPLFATLATRKENLTGDTPVSYWPIVFPFPGNSSRSVKGLNLAGVISKVG